MKFVPRLLIAALVAPAILSAQAKPIRIHADRLLDGGREYDDVTISVQGTKITGLEMGRMKRRPDYELGHATLLPGMIDAHAHLAWYFNSAGRLHTSNDGDTPAQSILAEQANALTTLLAGFTTVQSPGSPQDGPVRDSIAKGVIPGPRILTSLEPLSNPALSPDSLRALVRQRKLQGADFIKIFASKSIREGGAATLTAAQLGAICGEARAQGLRTLVHAHSAEAVQLATEAGCTQIEHGVFATGDVLREMAARGTYFDPQCGLVFNNYLENRPKYEGIGNYNEAGFAAMKTGIPLAQATFRLATAIPRLRIVFGTDAVAGAHGRNAEELICRVDEGGQSPMDAIVSATSLAAAAIGLGDQLGALIPGYEADIIAVDGMPDRDITALRKVVFVMKAGKVYKFARPPRR